MSIRITNEFIDELFENEYFIEKIKAYTNNQIKLSNIILSGKPLLIIDNLDSCISSYDEFIELSSSKYNTMCSLNKFDSYKDFLIEACHKSALLPFHFTISNTSEIVNLFCSESISIPNLFTTYKNSYVAYVSNGNYYYGSYYYGNSIGYKIMELFCKQSYKSDNGLKDFNKILNLMPENISNNMPNNMLQSAEFNERIEKYFELLPENFIEKYDLFYRKGFSNSTIDYLKYLKYDSYETLFSEYLDALYRQSFSNDTFTHPFFFNDFILLAQKFGHTYNCKEYIKLFSFDTKQNTWKYTSKQSFTKTTITKGKSEFGDKIIKMIDLLSNVRIDQIDQIDQTDQTNLDADMQKTYDLLKWISN